MFRDNMSFPSSGIKQPKTEGGTDRCPKTSLTSTLRPENGRSHKAQAWYKTHTHTHGRSVYKCSGHPSLDRSVTDTEKEGYCNWFFMFIRPADKQVYGYYLLCQANKNRHGNMSSENWYRLKTISPLVYRGVDKSLARPGRKRGTAT